MIVHLRKHGIQIEKGKQVVVYQSDKQLTLPMLLKQRTTNKYSLSSSTKKNTFGTTGRNINKGEFKRNFSKNTSAMI